MNEEKLVDSAEIWYEEPQIEIAPSVIERRFFLKAPLIAVAAIFLTRPKRLWAQETSPEKTAKGIDSGKFEFEKFFQECAVLAKQANQDPDLNEDAHIFRLSS